MRRVAFVVLISVLLLLAACGSKTTGKRVAIPDRQPQVKAPAGITGAVAVEPEPSSTGELGKSAAEALKELQDSPSIPTEGPKSGTFYPPITVNSTGQDALKEKTRALFKQPVYDPNVNASADFGSRYHSSDGDSTNLPDNYQDKSGD